MKEIKKLFNEIIKTERTVLLEHEVYSIFQQIGINTPDFIFIKKSEKYNPSTSRIKSDKVVVKVVSPQILHKTELGAVLFCSNNEDEINKAISTIDKRTTDYDVHGFIVVEMLNYKSSFGREAIVSVRNSRDFGTVSGFGLGGLDTEFFGKHMDNAFGVLSLDILDNVMDKVKNNAVYYKLCGLDRNKKRLIADEDIKNTINIMDKLGRDFSYSNSDVVISECEINPIVLTETEPRKLVALDALMKIEKNELVVKASRPKEKIDKLFHPKSIAVIGVSETSMNMGRIILNNVINKGFSKEELFVIKPDTKQIDGVNCYPSVKELPKKIDLLVLAVSASASATVIKDAIEYDKFESVIVIPGGFAEKEGGEKIEQEISSLIEKSRTSSSKGPVIVGGNCLGVVSFPGNYDTFFIPKTKMHYSEPKPFAFISQSGAFIISKISKTGLTPMYSASIGNQMDLSFSDYLNYFIGRKDINTVAVYIEGFKELDGIATAKAVKTLCSEGKKVLVYKGGRSSYGMSAASGHTASIAGAYPVCKAIMQDAGAIMVESFTEFEDVLKLCVSWGTKIIKGSGLALISNAGFETVGMGDNISKLSVAKLNKETLSSMTEVLKKFKLDTLVSSGNPMDVTPSANDTAYIECFKHMLNDQNISAGVLSCIPMTPAIKSIQAELGTESMFSMINELYESSEKPFVVVVDSGELYDPACKYLKKVPVFREADRAIKALEKYLVC